MNHTKLAGPAQNNKTTLATNPNLNNKTAAAKIETKATVPNNKNVTSTIQTKQIPNDIVNNATHFVNVTSWEA